MSALSLRTLALSLLLLAPSQVEAQLKRVSPQGQTTLVFQGTDSGCAAQDAASCFPAALRETLAGISGPAPVRAVLHETISRMKDISFLRSLLSETLPRAAEPDFRSPGVKRRALLVGVGNYEGLPRLTEAGLNLDLMSQVLQREGFMTQELRDPTGDELHQAFRALHAELAASVPENSLTLVYLYGHGVSVAGEKLFCPRDASYRSEAEARFVCLPLSAFETGDLALSVLLVDGWFDSILPTVR